MITRISTRDVRWSYAAQALNLGAGIVLLPLLLRSLSQEEVGIWFIFLSLAAFAQLLEFGFQPTISRNITYAYSGATQILSSGIPKIDESGEPNKILVSHLIAAAKWVYLLIGSVAALLLLIGGSLYISSLHQTTQPYSSALPAWILFSLGSIFNLYFGYINSALVGRGNILESNKIIVITKTAFLLLGVASLLGHCGLVGLGVASLASSGIGRLLAGHYFRKIIVPEINEAPDRYSTKNLIRALAPNAYRLGLAQIGGYLALRANLLVASSFLGLKSAAIYGLTMSLLNTLSGISSVIGQIQLPRMNALQAKGAKSELRNVFGAVLIVGWSIYLLGLSIIITTGPELLKQIGSNTLLLPTSMLATVGLVMLLELNHSLFATYLTTSNHIAFSRAAIYSSLAIITLSLLSISKLGLWALIIAQGLVQLGYNNWKWPMEALRDLRASPAALFSSGVLELRTLTRSSRYSQPNP